MSAGSSGSPRREFRVGEKGPAPYSLMTSIVVPRPIAWVSTVSANGVGNLAPHSFFTVASADPPVVMFTSVGRKDTLANVEATGEFVVNVATAPLLEAVNDSSAPFEPGQDEAAALGVELEASRLVAPGRVAGSPASMECRLHSVVDFGGGSVAVFGEVLLFAVHEDALVDDLPTMAALQPLSRLGRNEWGHPPTVFTLDRPVSVEDLTR